ncbi:MAG: hypothetical protein VYE40_19460 [Myxococcota bacterium]|nr:hypothetical protein [Myxococcota bacterium]
MKFHNSALLAITVSLTACSGVGDYKGPQDMDATDMTVASEDMPEAASDMSATPQDMGTTSGEDMPDTPNTPAPPALTAKGTAAGVELAWSPVPDALRYEVRIDGGDWINVLGELTYLDEEAPVGAITSATVSASDATRREAVDLTIEDLQTEEGSQRTYEVRAITADATTEPSNQESASRITEITSYQWQYTDSLENSDWRDIDGATTESAEDPGARGNGNVRYYKVTLSTASNELESEIDEGSRLAIIQIGAGSGHNCVLYNSGAVKCWGNNAAGPLGYGDTKTRGIAPGDMPPPDVNLGGKAKELRVGGSYNCVIMEDDTLKCWGVLGTTGETSEAIGDEPGEMPPPVIPINGKIKKLPISGATHQCVLLEDGVYCWGTNNSGELGQGDTTWRWTNGETNFPTQPVNLGGEVVDIESGLGYSCATLTTGELKCWGNLFGAGVPYGEATIGDEPSEIPPPVLPAVPETYDAVTLSEGFGGPHRCVIANYIPSSGSAIFCWGSNSNGQLGIGNNASLGSSPGDLPGPRITYDSTAKKIVTGLISTCLLKENNRLFCWGGGLLGNYFLGPDFEQNHGDDMSELRPKEVVLGESVEDISAGLFHHCALTTTGTVKCWGDGDHGALGYENANDLGAPTDTWPPPDVKLY